MCNGIAIVIVNDNGNITIRGKENNGSHDKLLHNIPIELHDKCIRIEYIFPGQFILDAPDDECKKEALTTELVEKTGIGNTIKLKTTTLCLLSEWLKNNPLNHPTQLLQKADLRGADLRGANLRGADLEGANLRGATLRGADLREANLRGADLREADLRGANLQGTDLQGADLQEANLDK